MRIDYQSDPDFADLVRDRYDLVDLDAGGELLSTLPIFFADDETGVYKLYVANANGMFLIDLNDPADEVLSETRHGRIKFVPKIADPCPLPT